MLEIALGAGIAAGLMAVSSLLERSDVRSKLGRLKPGLRSKRMEEMKKIDEKLEEVVKESHTKEKLQEVDDSELEEAAKQASEKFNVEGDILSEASSVPDVDVEPEEEKLPEVELSEDLEISTEDIDRDFEIGEDEEEEAEKVDFEEEDELISKIAKVAEVEEEEEFDLLRDLRGKEFSVEELEAELKEVVEMLRGMKGG